MWWLSLCIVSSLTIMVYFDWHVHVCAITCNLHYQYMINNIPLSNCGWHHRKLLYIYMQWCIIHAKGCHSVRMRILFCLHILTEPGAGRIKIDQQWITKECTSDKICHALCLSPDRKLLASTHAPSDVTVGTPQEVTLVFYDVMTGKCLLSYMTGHDSAITCICFSTDGRYVCTASIDHSIKVWLSPVLRLSRRTGHKRKSKRKHRQRHAELNGDAIDDPTLQSSKSHSQYLMDNDKCMGLIDTAGDLCSDSKTSPYPVDRSSSCGTVFTELEKSGTTLTAVDNDMGIMPKPTTSLRSHVVFMAKPHSVMLHTKHDSDSDAANIKPTLTATNPTPTSTQIKSYQNALQNDMKSLLKKRRSDQHTEVNGVKPGRVSFANEDYFQIIWVSKSCGFCWHLDIQMCDENKWFQAHTILRWPWKDVV